MPFARPTLTELRQQIATDLNAALPGVDALLRFSNLGIIGDVVAGAMNGQYGYLDWIAANQAPFTSADEYLEGWAGLIGITRKSPAAATGTVQFTGTDGSTIPTGTPMTRTDGLEFITTASGTIASGTATVAAQALATGSASNSNAGATMILTVGISGVNAAGTVAAAFTGGADVETDTSLRSRMNAAYAAPPQGGSYNDYQQWTLAVPGVDRVWITPGTNPGSIFVYFMMDAAESAFGGFPQGTNGCATLESRDTTAAGDQLTVANALFQVQPVHVLLYAIAPAANPVSFTITGLGSASTATKAQVEAAISSALAFNASIGGVTDISVVEEAIAFVALTEGFAITAVTCTHGTVTGSARNITASAGYLNALGAVTFS